MHCAGREARIMARSMHAAVKVAGYSFQYFSRLRV